MPTESILIMLLKVVLPTILGAGLGAGITLYGLRQNNKHNAAENKANRDHQLQVEIAKAEIAAKYKSQDRRWEFRKDVHVNVIKAASQVLDVAKRLGPKVAELYTLQQQDKPFQPTALRVVTEVKSCFAQLQTAELDLELYTAIAPLATADDVLPLLTTLEQDMRAEHTINLDSPDNSLAWTKDRTDRLTALIAKLQEAGRKDLWGTPETEAKAGATT
jgi:uncharacterized protein with von Willebrand factor type A (vWA) domain